MNVHALYHKSDSLYSYALTPDTVELRLRTARGDVNSAELIYGMKHSFCRKQYYAPMRLLRSDALFDYFSVQLKLKDKRLAYIFRIKAADGKIYYFSEDGATEKYDFAFGYFSFFQLAFVNECDVMQKADWLESAVVYQIFVDRFYNVIPQEDGYVNLKVGQNPKPKDFGGGDLLGVAEKLPYLKQLGVNTIYLTPIFESESNHKYDTIDYYNVDRHFGGNAAFKTLMKECKANGIRVILDAVFNHASDKCKQFSDVKLRGNASPYHDYFIINGDFPVMKPLNYEVFAECEYMPKWNTSNPEVRKLLCDIGGYYIEEYGIDGWRLDVSDEVSHALWKEFRAKIKSYGKDKVLIGENWHDSRSYLRGDEFDSIMNYAFTKAMLDYFARETADAEATADKLNELLMRNFDQVNRMMLNLCDSHDTHRFYTECGEDKEKLLSALYLNVFMPGATMVYYGTEIPLSGGYDPDCRKMFDWDAPKDFYERVKTALSYKSRPELKGEVIITAENGCLVVERVNGRKLTLIINNTKAEAAVRGVKVAAGSRLVI